MKQSPPRTRHHLFAAVLCLFSLVPLAAGGEEKRAVVIGFDGAYGLKQETSASAIELGLQVAIKEINASGGVLGGRPLKLITRDNRSVPARGVANLKEFAAMPDLVAMVGGRFSPVLLQQIDLAHQLQLPLIDAWGAANGVTDHQYKPSYSFRVSLKDAWAMPVMLAHIKKMGKRRVGVLLPNTGWGRSNQHALGVALKELPQLEVVDVLWYNFGEKQMLAKYQQLLAKGAEVLLLVANDHEGSRLIRQLGEEPTVQRLPIVSHWGVTGGRMVEVSGPALHEIDFSMVQTFSFFKAQPHMVERFMRGAAEIGGYSRIEELRSPVGMAHAYDLMHILAKAIERAGSTDRSAIRAALESGIKHNGLVRDYNPAFTPANHDALSVKQVFMARYRRDGVIVPLE